MHEELERKFLLKDLTILKNKPKKLIEQIYFSKSKPLEKTGADLVLADGSFLVDAMKKDLEKASSVRIRKTTCGHDINFQYTCKIYDAALGGFYEKELEILPANKAHAVFEALEMQLELKNQLFEVIAKLITNYTSSGLIGMIKKVRYDVKNAGVLYEVDEYMGSLTGLYTVEVEAPGYLKLEEKKAFLKNIKLPNWVGADITHDKKYSNKHLAEKSVIL